MASRRLESPSGQLRPEFSLDEPHGLVEGDGQRRPALRLGNLLEPGGGVPEDGEDPIDDERDDRGRGAHQVDEDPEDRQYRRRGQDASDTGHDQPPDLLPREKTRTIFFIFLEQEVKGILAARKRREEAGPGDEDKADRGKRG